MIDKRSQYILLYVNKIAEDRYVVLSLNEISAEIMKNTDYSTGDIHASVRELASLGYIRLKYDDGENFCLTSTEKGRSFVDVAEENQKTYVKLFGGYKSVVGWMMFSAFCGSFVGGVVTAVALKFIWG